MGLSGRPNRVQDVPVTPPRIASAGDPDGDGPRSEDYVRIEGVTKAFGGVTAVDDVSLGVHRGEIFCLLGSSGCGKTTLLRILAGFEAASSGRVLIDGEDMTGIPPYERPVNIMFQSYALFPHMTVENNIAFGLRQERIAAREIKRRVRDMLDLVRLLPFARRRPHQLSGGQRQRVALARALVKQPKLLLLDEPLAALDKKLREEMQFELITIQKEVGVTFVVVTHDQEEAMTLSDRIGVMDAGRIVQTGTPTAIYESPGTRFVAGFIGSVNLFEGRVVAEDAHHLIIECEGAGCPLYSDRGVSAARGDRVCVAVRPEKLEISRDAPSREYNRIESVVTEVAYRGGLSIYRLLADSGTEIRVSRPNLARASADRPGLRERVYVSWHPSSSVVLVS